MNVQILSLMIAIGLIGFWGTQTNPNLTEYLRDAELVAATQQTHQLTLALELYFVKNKRYPDVSSEELPSILFKEGYLTEPRSLGTVTYQAKKAGAEYILYIN